MPKEEKFKRNKALVAYVSERERQFIGKFSRKTGFSSVSSFIRQALFEDIQNGTVADDIAAIEEVHFRKTKGKSGRWSGPPIEMTCEESIEAIEKWQEANE